MNKRTLVPVLTVSILTVMALAPAHAGGWMTAEIPFSFSAGSNAMAAGSYIVGVQEGAYRIWNTKSHVGFLGLLTGPCTGLRGKMPDPHLAFHRLGDQYFLSEISLGEGDVRTLPRSKKELEAEVAKSGALARTGVKTERVYIAAR